MRAFLLPALVSFVLAACADIPTSPTPNDADPLFAHLTGVSSGLAPGDILVPDPSAFGSHRPALFRVDPSTGDRTVFSDFTDATQGPTAISLTGVTIDAGGQIWLVSGQQAHVQVGGGLFRLDPATGHRVLVSDFRGPGQGPVVGQTFRAVSDGSTVFVSSATTVPPGSIYAVDAATGQRVLLSDLGDAAQGPTGHTPFNMVLDAAGDILVADLRAGPAGRGLIMRVDPTTGTRTQVAHFLGQPVGANLPHGLAIEPSGQLLVTTITGGTNGRGALLRIDPATGTGSLVSDFGDPAQGPLGASAARGVVVAEDGSLLVMDENAGGSGLLFSVDPVTGMRTVLSDFSNPAQGTLGDSPWDVAVVARETVLTVRIDIRPGSAGNPVNPRSRGSIPVAVLSDSGFDAPAEVDAATLTFGATGTEHSLVRCGEPEDADGDGLADLVCHFSTEIAGFGRGDQEGVLEGATLSGRAIRGTDLVRVVGSG
jgi:outer membrane protein assembly factor BamB